MAYKYFINPFADAGNKTDIPETSPSDGSVSYATGYGPYYQEDIDTDPNALAIERDKFNELMFVITQVLQQYQRVGVPQFITSAMNGGTPYSYSRYDFAFTGNIYQSLVNGNTTDPAVNKINWRLCDFSADKVTIDGVTFAAGVVNGDMVYWDSVNSVYDKAIADGTVKQNVVGIADVPSARVVTAGEPSIFVGLITNSEYFLSTTVAGTVTNIRPTDNIVFLGIARNSSRILLNILPPIVNGTALIASVYLSAAQSIPGGNVATLVQFDSVEFDAAGLWQGTPDYSFKLKRAGNYNFTGRMFYKGPGASSVY